MASLISAAVMSVPEPSRKNKKKKSSNKVGFEAGSAIEIRGGVIELEQSLLSQTSDPLTTPSRTTPANGSSSNPQQQQSDHQSPEMRTVRSDPLAFSAFKYQQSVAPCYGGIGGDDNSEAVAKQSSSSSADIDSAGAGSANGGYSQADVASPNGRAKSSSTSDSGGSPVTAEELKRKASELAEVASQKASKLGGLLKGKFQLAGDSISKMIKKKTDKEYIEYTQVDE